MVKTGGIRMFASIGYWLGIPVLITLAGFFPGQIITHSTLLLLYLSAVLFTSLRSNQVSVVTCALSGFLLFSYFHMQPRFSLLVNAGDEIVSAVVFVVFAVIAGSISGKLSRQLMLLKEQKEFFSTQVVLNQNLQDIADSSAIPDQVNALFGKLFQQKVLFSLQSGADIPDSDNLMLAWDYRGEETLGPDREAMLLALKEQVQNVLHRIATAKALKEAERRSDEEKLRAALLSSVSHDLKTPLVTMLGAATSLRDLRDDISSEDADELLESIISESQRLESYIQNLLDMTRLGHGRFALIRDWVSIDEIYHVVSRRISRMVATPRMTLHMTAEVPSLYIHAALIEQGLFNVIDNALKAAGADAEIRVDVRVINKKLQINVSDQGPGLPSSEWEAVFDSFYTFSLGDCYEKGTGLGLSICRSVFRVHGGDAVIVEAPSGFSHCVQLRLPLPANNIKDEGEDHD